LKLLFSLYVGKVEQTAQGTVHWPIKIEVWGDPEQAFSGFVQSLDSDGLILLFLGLVTPLFLFNFMFTTLSSSKLKMGAILQNIG
jgi:hypothetical protein